MTTQLLPTRTIAPRTIVATFSDSERSGKTCASKYAAEIADYFDSREKRELRSMMSQNRAPFFS